MNKLVKELSFQKQLGILNFFVFLKTLEIKKGSTQVIISIVSSFKLDDIET